MDRKEALELVEEIDEDGVDVTNWEAEFLDSMMKWLEKRNPTNDQVKIINQIYEDRIK